VRKRLKHVDVKTLNIEPGSPWENGYVKSFNGTLQDQMLNREIFDTLLEVMVLIECWRREHSKNWPHSSLSYQPLAPEAMTLYLPAFAKLQSANTDTDNDLKTVT